MSKSLNFYNFCFVGYWLGKYGICIPEQISWCIRGKLTLCILEPLKRVLWQTVKTQMKCSIMQHQGLHCLLRLKQNSGTEIHHNIENSTWDPFKYTMGSPILSVSICMWKSIRIHTKFIVLYTVFDFISTHAPMRAPSSLGCLDHMVLVVTKPVFRVSAKVRFKPVCSATETR